MDVNEFYEKTNNIILYPGSLADMHARKPEMRYEELGLDGPKQYLSGPLFPSKDDLMAQVVGGVGLLGIDEADADEFSEMVNVLFEQVISNPEMLKMDLRWKAYEVGANALVHVRLFDKEGQMMGVPIVEKGDPRDFSYS